MDKDNNIISCYRFLDKNDYKDSETEAETISYIKANTDLNDPSKVLKLYHRLIEKQTLKTIIGLEFLKELRDSIEKSGIASTDKLPYIKISKDDIQVYGKVYKGKIAHDQEKKHKDLVKEYSIRHRNSRIINFFLIIIIIVMICIALFNDNYINKNYEEEIIARYSSWEKELEQRENQINDIE